MNNLDQIFSCYEPRLSKPQKPQPLLISLMLLGFLSIAGLVMQVKKLLSLTVRIVLEANLALTLRV